MQTIVNDVAAKFAVAIVAVAMVFGAFASTASAQTLEEQIADLLAQISQLEGELGGSSVSTGGSSVSGMYTPPCPITWTRNLNMGSTGADVMALQQLLNADADTRVAVSGAGAPGSETMYYGPATGAAVSKFQMKYRSEILTPVNLVSPTTYFGPSTRNKANMLCTAAPVTPSTPSTGGDDTMDDDDMMDDDTSSNTSLGNGEGSIDQVNGASADESNLEEGTEGGVVALDLEIEGDVQINRVDVYADSNGTAGASNNADDYFDRAILYVDGVEVADVDVDDFDEDSYSEVTGANGDEFRIRFSGLDLIFADGDEPEIQVGFEVLGNLDSSDQGENWTVYIESIRFEDGEGFFDTEDITLGDGEDTFGFDPEEVAELTITEADNNPDATTIEVDDNDRTDDVTVFVFNIEEENDVAATVEDMTISVTTSPNAPDAVVTEAAIFDGSTELDSASVPNSGIVQFENMGLEIGAEEIVELTVKLTFEDTNSQVAYQNGETVVVAVVSIDDAEDDNGNDESDMTITGTPNSETHNLRETGLDVQYSDDDIREIENDDTTNADDQVEFTLEFDVTAFGDDLYLPFGAASGTDLTSGVEFSILDDNNAVVSTGVISAPSLDVADSSAEKTNSYKVSRNSSERFTLKATYDPAVAGSYKLRLDNVNFAVTDAGTATVAQDVSGQDIDTTKASIQN